MRHPLSMSGPFIPIPWPLQCRRYCHSVSSSALHVHSARSWCRSVARNICDIHSLSAFFRFRLPEIIKAGGNGIAEALYEHLN